MPRINASKIESTIKSFLIYSLLYTKLVFSLIIIILNLNNTTDVVIKAINRNEGKQAFLHTKSEILFWTFKQNVKQSSN